MTAVIVRHIENSVPLWAAMGRACTAQRQKAGRGTTAVVGGNESPKKPVRQPLLLPPPS
jgi:hypothetical protein